MDDWFLRSSERSFPVVSDGRLHGLVCFGDLRKLAQDRWAHEPVTAIMTPAARLTVVAPGDEAQTGVRRLGDLDVDQVPIVDAGVLVGMLSRSDVARWIEVHLDARPRLGRPRTA